MSGALVVIVLSGMLIPILMLLAAVVFDVALVTWVALHEWHDHWSPELRHVAKGGFARLHRAQLPHG